MSAIWNSSDGSGLKSAWDDMFQEACGSYTDAAASYLSALRSRIEPRELQIQRIRDGFERASFKKGFWFFKWTDQKKTRQNEEEYQRSTAEKAEELAVVKHNVDAGFMAKIGAVRQRYSDFVHQTPAPFEEKASGFKAKVLQILDNLHDMTVKSPEVLVPTDDSELEQDGPIPFDEGVPKANRLYQEAVHEFGPDTNL